MPPLLQELFGVNIQTKPKTGDPDEIETAFTPLPRLAHHITNDMRDISEKHLALAKLFKEK